MCIYFLLNWITGAPANLVKCQKYGAIETCSIMRMTLNGSSIAPFATGIRNTVGKIYKLALLALLNLSSFDLYSWISVPNGFHCRIRFPARNKWSVLHLLGARLVGQQPARRLFGLYSFECHWKEFQLALLSLDWSREPWPSITRTWESSSWRFYGGASWRNVPQQSWHNKQQLNTLVSGWVLCYLE